MARINKENSQLPHSKGQLKEEASTLRYHVPSDANKARQHWVQTGKQKSWNKGKDIWQ